MDTSEKYIEMCQKAEDIQKNWIINKGDYISVPFETYPEPWCESLGWSGFNKPFDGIWLPRQDQLIEMNIRASREKYNYVNFDDFDIIKDMIEYTDYTFKTLEKFLLNELMVTKYGKHWNGKDWVVE